MHTLCSLGALKVTSGVEQMICSSGRRDMSCETGFQDHHVFSRALAGWLAGDKWPTLKPLMSLHPGLNSD